MSGSSSARGPLRDHKDMPGHLARRFQQLASAVFHAQMEATGCDLTSVQYAALATVARRPRIDQATLANEIAYDRATITGVVDRLLKKGLLSRTVNEADRRARELQVTEEGAALLQAIEPAVDRAQQAITARLTAREAEQLMTLLGKAVDLNPAD